MQEKFILAGFGGQGIMFLGKLLCMTFMNEDENVTYIPSYGAEQRGGTANCNVVISDKPIGSPVVEKATTIVAMNQPSYEKFKNSIQDGGIIFINSSMIKAEKLPDSIKLVEVPATAMASELGNVKLANMIMLGAILAHKNFPEKEKFFSMFNYFLTGKKAKLVDINKQAVEKGLSIFNQ